MQRPALTIQACIDVELTDNYAIVRVDVSGHTDQVKLRRGDRANHLHVRDFMHELANRQSVGFTAGGTSNESHS